MKEKLRKLLMIPEDHMDGVIKPIKLNSKIHEKVDAEFYYIQLQSGNTRIDDFMSIVESALIPYCLTREEATSAGYLSAAKLYKEAKETFVRGDHSGEIGEIGLYMLLESKLLAPQILSKMSLKTAGNMNYHGSDAIHLKVNDCEEKLLFFGESKVYNDLRGSVDACLNSISSFYFDELVTARTQFNFELKLIKNHLDVDELELKKLIIDLVDPWKGGKEDLKYVNACLIFFEWDFLDDLPFRPEKGIEIEQILIEKYQEEVNRIMNILEEKIIKKNMENLDFHFFFIPIPKAKAFRDRFLEMLGFKDKEVENG